jgi:CheY-like chemotaxis protein
MARKFCWWTTDHHPDDGRNDFETAHGVRVRDCEGWSRRDLRAVVESPDLVLMDVVMPRMNGFEACKRMRMESSLRQAPVIRDHPR